MRLDQTDLACVKDTNSFGIGLNQGRSAKPGTLVVLIWSSDLAVQRVVGSIPTAPTRFPMFPTVSSLIIPESTNRYYLGREVLIQSTRGETWKPPPLL
jgi:hypothetical protein